MAEFQYPVLLYSAELVAEAVTSTLTPQTEQEPVEALQVSVEVLLQRERTHRRAAAAVAAAPVIKRAMAALVVQAFKEAAVAVGEESSTSRVTLQVLAEQVERDGQSLGSHSVELDTDD